LVLRDPPDFAVFGSVAMVLFDLVVLVEGLRPRVAVVTTVSSARSES
jgi:hypothetical protein